MTSVAEHFVTVSDDVELYVRDEGAGERAIVFITGWSCTHDFFVHQFGAFSASYRTIFYDPRGAGRSSTSLGGNNYARHGEDLARLLDRLNVMECVLAPWSYGNHAALNYIAANGLGRVRGYLNIDSSPKPMSSDAHAWRDGGPDELAGYYQAVRDGQRDFFAGYADAMVSRPLTDAERNWIVRHAASVDPFAAAATFADGHFSDGRDAFIAAARSVAAMVMVNEASAPAAKAWLDDHAPEADVEVYPSHMLFWEFPERFNEQCLEFCARAFGDKKPKKKTGLGFLTRR